MADKQPLTPFERGFIQRVREARTASFDSQEEIAELLGIEQGRYKNYETNRLLPHEFIHHFCALTRFNIAWLFAGHGPRRMPVLNHSPPKRRQRAKAPPTGE